MDLPGTAAEPVTNERRRRRLVVVVILAFVVLGLVGVTGSAWARHDVPHVVALTAAQQRLADPATRKSDTSTTPPYRTTTTVKPVVTTTVTFATTVLPATTPPSTTRYVGLPTTPTSRYVPPVTTPTTKPYVPPTTTPTTSPAAKTVTKLLDDGCDSNTVTVYGFYTIDYSDGSYLVLASVHTTNVHWSANLTTPGYSYTLDGHTVTWGYNEGEC
jgi:hypothetical protein